MKKAVIATSLLLILITFTNLPLYAKIWRINNRSDFNGTTLFGGNLGGTAAFPVFKEINQAVGWADVSATAGDTLHIEGSPSIYADATITKKLIIIGTGYLLNENPNVSNTVMDSQINNVTFNAGSEGSQLIGLDNVYSSSSLHKIFINVNNIVIKRCRIEQSIQILTDLSNVTILQCFFAHVSSFTALTHASSSFYVPPSDLVFNNNICQKTLIWDGPILQCNNNVFDGPANALNLQFNTSEFRNNILKATNATTDINGGTNLNVSYNTGTNSNQFGTSNNNIVVANMSTLFVDPVTNSTDGDYQLQSGSAAGADGADRGAFGGLAVTSRYTLSGLAPIPVIYEINTTGVATPSGLNVNIKAKTIK